jgi:hypothetical protein
MLISERSGCKNDTEASAAVTAAAAAVDVAAAAVDAEPLTSMSDSPQQ